MLLPVSYLSTLTTGADVVLLLTGSSTGEVRVWAASAAALASGSRPQCVLALQHRQRLPVLCLDAKAGPHGAGGRLALLLAAGTSAGGLIAFRSGDFSGAGGSLGGV